MPSVRLSISPPHRNKNTTLKRLFLTLLCAVSWSLDGQTKPSTQQADFAFSKAWINLLFYSGSAKDSYKSRVINSEFFIHPSGRTDPSAELKATIELFKKQIPTTDDHPQCLFPARYHLLKQHFQLQPPIQCKRLNNWTKSYAPKQMDLVYASQYISNPASVFGHIFLSTPSDRQTESLWQTYNFAAGIPKETSGFGYIWGGLTGWFYGDFSIMPYYQRLYQYGNIENRDLWVFPLKLSDSELQQMLRHLWELVHRAKFEYYFMDENCAGVLLRLFAANLNGNEDLSDLPLTSSPLAVIQTMYKLDRLDSPKWVASRFNRVKTQVAQLTSKQESAFYKSIYSHPAKLSTTDPTVAEAIIEYLSFVTHENHGKLPEPFQDLEKSSYLLRAKSNQPALEINHPNIETASPEKSHPPFAANLGYSILNSDQVFDFSFRFAMHDMLDPEAGFIANSTLETMDLQLSTNGKDLWLKKLTLFNMENIQPVWLFAPQFSWRAFLGWQEDIFTKSHLFDNYFSAELAYGGGADFGGSTFYILADIVANIGSEMTPSHYETGPEIGWIYSAGWWKSLIKARYLKSVLDDLEKDRFETRASFRIQLNKNLSWIQEYHWTQINHLNQQAHRLNTQLRYYF